MEEQLLNSFERRLTPSGDEGLRSCALEILQVNLGLRCNMSCAHCHVSAGPNRTEAMDWPTMEAILELVQGVPCRLVDLTGGAPELNPHLQRFIESLGESGLAVQVRTNLTVLLEPECAALPEFFQRHKVRLVASMPCYLKENVRSQRGAGAYEAIIGVIQGLNTLGYGLEADLPLSLVYNPIGPALPPAQAGLEADYRRELRKRFGIEFTDLLTITNAPIGRFQRRLCAEGREADYLRLLRDAFNPETVERLMCRSQLSIGWDGALYDCDFNLALGRTVDHGAPDHIRDFDLDGLISRRIVTGEHCFACTAGAGSSCRGALS